ncbi:MAG: lysophospholipid acyltransferase family protein [Nitrospiraceae bacterium]
MRNLSVVHGLELNSPDLQARATATLRNAIYCYVDFVIDAYGGPEALDAAYELDPVGVDLIKSHLAAGRGVVLVTPHMCSLDLFALAISKRFADVQALTLAGPPINSRLVNHLRRKYGMHVTPIDHDSLRAAIRRLRRGGIVGIAADVPVSYGARIPFFGRPCLLPIGHSRLAEATNAAVVVGESQRLGPRSYRGTGTEIPQGDMDEEQWAAAIIRVIEGHIAARPDEWFTTAPLWIDGPGIDIPPLLFQHRLPTKLTCRLIKR